MKLNSLFPLIAAISIASIGAAQAQVSKSGGLFGFKKKGEQLSSDLFPEEEPSAEEQALQEATNISAETDSKKKKGGLFSFGKKNDDTSGRPAISPTPAESVPTSQGTPQETPQFVEKEDKKMGGLPFFNKNKEKEETTEELQAIASNPIYNSPEMVATESGSEEEIVSPTPENSTEETVPAAPVPNFVGSSEPEKEEDGNIFSRMSIPKMPKKKTDYVEVETVMKNGEFVNEDEEPDFTVAPTLPATGESDGPEIINGVKVYSSWDEVEASSMSEADRIISRMR